MGRQRRSVRQRPRPSPRSPAMKTLTARRSSSRNQFTTDTAMDTTRGRPRLMLTPMDTQIELKKPVYHGYGYGYHKREAEADAYAHGYAYEKVTKTICKKKPITEEVSKDFELCRPKPSEVCEEKEIKVPRLVCEEPAEKKVEDAETI